jgi:glutamine synthetase
VRTADERPVAQGGEGARARPLLAADRGGFVEQHELWREEQYAAAAQLRRVIDEVGIERIRLAFVDQHGILRSKTVTHEALPGALRDGIRAPSSLLLKDTSGRSSVPMPASASRASRARATWFWCPIRSRSARCHGHPMPR